MPILRFASTPMLVRSAAADADFAVAIAPHPVNGDEQKYPNLIGSDTRGLPHDERGEVDRAAFDATLKAYASGDPADFEAIPLGGKRKQLNPIGSLAVNLTGCVGPQFAIPPAPALDSATRASEAVELYWQSLLRDVPLSELTNDTKNKDVLAAVDELNKLAAFSGPRKDGGITPETLFRGTALYVDAADPSGQNRALCHAARHACRSLHLAVPAQGRPVRQPAHSSAHPHRRSRDRFPHRL